MSTMTKVFVVLTAVLSIVASVLFISAAAQWHSWRDLAETYKTGQAAALTAKANVEATLQAALAMKDDALQTKDRLLAEARDSNQKLIDEMAQVQSELVRERNDAVASEAGRVKLQEILGVVTGEVTGLRKQNHELLLAKIANQNEISELNNRVLELTANTTILTEQVRNLQEKNYAYEQRLADLQKQLATGGTTVSLSGAAVAVMPTVAGPILGEIAEVDGSYAAINIGESSGIVSGMVLMVYREGSFLGELVISQVLPNESVGRLRMLQGDVRPGDRVAFEQS